MSVVELDRVTVRYGSNVALRDVQAVFPSGAVGLLGPNGAGKSTMIKSLLGFVVPDEGQMRVLGLDVRTSPLRIRGRVGYMPESDAHIPGMNAVSFVAYCGELAGLPRADAMQRAHEVLYYVGLGEARYRNVEQYSTGMKQRIKLAQALVHDPDLLFLDEPTNGMDPKGRDEMLELIRDIAHNKGLNLILSSHLLPDVEYTCDHVVVMDKGAIATQGPIAALKGHGRPGLGTAGQGGRDAADRAADRGRARVPRDRRGRDAGVRARRSRRAVPLRAGLRAAAAGAPPARQRADAGRRVRPRRRRRARSADADSRSGLRPLRRPPRGPTAAPGG